MRKIIVIVSLLLFSVLLFFQLFPQHEQSGYSVATEELKLTDNTRPTYLSHLDKRVSENRTLPVTLWYPDIPDNDQSGVANRLPAFPLVIYSHGFISMRQEGMRLARFLASRGYIVAATNYPETTFWSIFYDGPDLAGVMNQPKDISFIIDRLLDRNRDVDNKLFQSIDETRIAAVGVSLGGMTSTLVAFHKELRDQRIKAAVSIAGPVAMFDKSFFAEASIPFLMIASHEDAIVSYHENAAKLKELFPQANLIVMTEASHAGFASTAADFAFTGGNLDKMGCWAIKSVMGEERISQAWNFGDEKAGMLANIEMWPFCETFPEVMEPEMQQDMMMDLVFQFLDKNISN